MTCTVFIKLISLSVSGHLVFLQHSVLVSCVQQFSIFFLQIITTCFYCCWLSSAVFDCDSSLFYVFICMTHLCTQKSVHFLCLEAHETDKNVLKFHFLLLGPLLILKYQFLLCPGRAAERVIISLSVCVCLSASISLEPLVWSSPIFGAYHLWPWLGPCGIGIYYVPPVMWMSPYLVTLVVCLPVTVNEAKQYGLYGMFQHSGGVWCLWMLCHYLYLDIRYLLLCSVKITWTRQLLNSLQVWVTTDLYLYLWYLYLYLAVEYLLWVC